MNRGVKQEHAKGKATDNNSACTFPVRDGNFICGVPWRQYAFAKCKKLLCIDLRKGYGGVGDIGSV